MGKRKANSALILVLVACIGAYAYVVGDVGGDQATSETQKEPGTVIDLQRDEPIKSMAQKVKGQGRYLLRGRTPKGELRVASIVVAPRITDADRTELLKVMDTAIRSWEKAADEIVNLSQSPAPRQLQELAAFLRRIETVEVEKSMLLSGEFFAFENGFGHLDTLLRSMDPVGYPDCTFSERFVHRPGGRTVTVVFVVDPRAHPGFAKARQLEIDLRSDRLSKHVEEFNSRPPMDRKAAHDRVKWIEAALRSDTPPKKKHELYLELQRLRPGHTWIDSTTYRLVRSKQP